MSHDVFISYSSKDKTIADTICAKLEEQKIRCWIAPRDIHAGQNFARSIINAIDVSQIFVLVWSANTNTSEHILNEINQAFDQGIPIIPFRIQEVQPTSEMRYYFGRTHWLDALTPPLQKHIGTLAQSINAILESKSVVSPEPLPIKSKESLPEKEELEEILQITPSQVPEKDGHIEPSPELEPKAETITGGRDEMQIDGIPPPAETTKKKRKLLPILGIGIVAAIFGTLSLLGVFKGFSSNTSKAPPTYTDSSFQLTATLTPTRIMASLTPSKEIATSTANAKNASATPEYLWATRFFGEIMTAIKYREPDFKDDFSYRKTDWRMGDGTGNPDCKNTFSKITDGKLIITSNLGECYAWANLQNLNLHNFVVQIDMDLKQIDSNGSIVISGATYSEDFSFDFANAGYWNAWYCQPEGKCTQSLYGQISMKDLSLPVTVTVIFNGTENGVFLNSIPVYHDYMSSGNSPIRHLSITVQNGTENFPLNRVEFDNLKIWDLDKIESLSPTSTKSN